MRCKSCDYPLWQIRDRRCPECGAGFKPSDFEFVLNSVRFCCPYCNQSYYGTGEKGHLVPPAFECVTCHRAISMDEMILLPTEGVREAQTKVEMNPWLERREKGVVRGWFSTVIQSMGAPGRLIRATPEQSSLLQAVWYATVTNAIYLLAGVSLFILLFLVIGIITATTGGSGPGGGGIAGVMAPMAFFAGWAIGMVVAIVAGAFIWGAMAHGLLRLTGPTSAGIGRTMQCMLYSSGTNIANAVPCVGFYIGWLSAIWWTVAAILMIKDGQKVSGGRATLAAVLPMCIVFAAVIGVIALAIVMPLRTTIATAQAAAAKAQAAQLDAGDAGRISQLAAALVTHAEEYGEPPRHATEVIQSQHMWVAQFLQPGIDQVSRLESSRVVGISLADIGRADGETTDRMIAAAAASLPSGVIAHRVGDTVFCYHGMDFSTADPMLWTVISSREAGSGPAGFTVVGLVNGSVQAISAEEFPAALAAQNTLRAAANLPPLPDPASILSDRPAVQE